MSVQAQMQRAPSAGRKLTHLLSAVEKTVLELISTGAPLPDVLAVLSRIIEEQSPGLLCSILLLDCDGVHLRHGAAPSLPESYNRAIDGLAIGPCVGSCGTAVFRGEAVIVSDIAGDPLWKDYRELALSHGLRACWATPIVSRQGVMLGSFAMYYRKRRSPRPRDLQIIERATHLARIAIERQQSEEALRQAENKYRSIVENAVQGIFQTTPDGGYLSVNPALARIYGYDSPDALMLAVKDIGHQVYVDSGRRAEFKRLMEEHDVVRDFEYEVRRKDGGRIWLSETARAVRNAAGEIAYYEGSVDEITARKRADLEREAMFEIIRGVNVTANLDQLLRLIHQSLGKVICADNCFIALHNKSTGEFHFPFFVDQYDEPPPPQKLGKSCTYYVFRTGQAMLIPQNAFDHLVAQGEVELVGTPSPAWLGVPLRTPTETIGVLVVQHYSDENAYSQRDLEFLVSVGGQIAFAIERKQADEALRTAEAKFRTLVEQLPAIIYIAELGAYGRWHYTSPKIQSLLGYSPEEWMADPEAWPKHIHPEDRERVLAAEARCQETGEPFLVEYRMFARDGRELWFRDEAVVVGEQTNLRGVVQGVLYDITERKRLEDHLRQAQKMEAVGRLAGGVAHDFNNLLMVIKGHGSILLDRHPPGDPAHRSVEQVQKAADRAASLTRQLLAFSRMQVLQPRVLDLNSVVAEMGKMVRRLIGEDIELILGTDPTLGCVKADPGQIEQVILNLAVNARDAMPRGGKLVVETANVVLDEIYVRRHPPLAAGRYVMLAVSDSGAGIDAETQAHIFEPFFTTKEKGKGTGLGLATVYGVVRQSGGHISVYSQPGNGATFRIYLPRVDELVEALQPGIISSAVPRGTETVLLAEDEEDVRELARASLVTSGYTVLEARDGAEAMRVAEEHGGPIHLLLSDVVMPRMGGPELASHLTALHPGLKVLYMSGYSEYIAAGHGIRDGGTAFLQKPFALELLPQKVREVLGKPAESPRSEA